MSQQGQLPLSVWFKRSSEKLHALYSHQDSLTAEQRECLVELLNLVFVMEVNFSSFRKKVEYGVITDLVKIVAADLDYKSQLADVDTLIYELESSCKRAA